MWQQVYNFIQSNPLVLMFLVCTLGYLIGGIKIKGLSLGTAGILLVALIFGHLGFSIPSIIQNIGLIIFVTSVGFFAGPSFVKIFKNNAWAYIILGIVIILSSVASCIILKYIANIPTDLSLGLLSGALTTTPGLAAAIEVTNSDLVSVGYGIAYPFGVLSIVLFVQFIPKIFKIDIKKEKAELEAVAKKDITPSDTKKFVFDGFGFCMFSLAILLGILLGKLTIPMPNGGGLSLGNSGGPLIMGIIFGHFGHIGKIDISVKKSTLKPIRELGLALFLLGAGIKAGAGFVNTLSQYGVMLFVYGGIMAIVPILVGYVIARKVFKLNTLNSLGCLCGGMTSTPALGTLITVSKTDEVSSAYAATYPIALLSILIAIQFCGLI